MPSNTSSDRRARTPLRLGVIGLGRLWDVRHKPSVAALGDRFRVAAVYDQVARRAELEAAQLGCDASESLRTLLHRDDLDAILLTAPQWFGLHALRLTREAGKPVYCALNAAENPEDFERLAIETRERSPESQVIFELARRRYPATLRLRRLFAGELGPPRSILGVNRLFGFDRNALPGPASQMAPSSLAADPGGYLLDWIRSLIGADPIRVQAVHDVSADPKSRPNPDFLGIHASFPDGAFAHVTVIRRPAGQTHAIREVPLASGFEIQTERGVAWVELPDRVRWSTGDLVHDERLSSDAPVGVQLLHAFHQTVCGDVERSHVPAPGWDDALAIARMTMALRHV